MAGRVLAVHVRNSWLDITVFALYMPTAPSTEMHKAKCDKVMQWVYDTLARLPSRTWPVLLADANAHVGAHTAGRRVQ